MWERPRFFSLVSGLARAARETPDKVAIHYRVWHGTGASLRVDAWQSATYREFWQRVCTIAHGVATAGAAKGDVCLVMWLPPSQMDALALMFALLVKGLVIMWLDPRTMTFDGLLGNVEKVAPKVMIAGRLVKSVFRIVQVLRRRVRCIKLIVGPKLLQLKDAPPLLEHVPMELAEDDGGLVVFTTGSTGPPKAVRLTHRCLAAQLDAYQELAQGFELGGPGDLVACHSALNFNAFDLALGNTTVTLPDPANPKNIRPEFLVDIDTRFQAVLLTGSRVVFENLAAHGERVKSASFLASLRLGFAGGAPVSPLLHERVRKAIPSLKELFSAYGATEGLPLLIAGSRETWEREGYRARSEQRGDGVALGRACPHVVLRVLRLDAMQSLDAAAAPGTRAWDDAWEAAPDEVGELVVDSPSVSREYVGDARATSASKLVRSGGVVVMHRTGDLVCRDADGALWMVGRASQAVKLDAGWVHPVCIESLFEGFPGVRRCALVGPKDAKGRVRSATLVVLANSLFSAADARVKVRASKWSWVDLDVVVYTGAKEFPMDPRHNSKIRRELLQRWVETQQRTDGL